jgi:hypothetical protein
MSVASPFTMASIDASIYPLLAQRLAHHCTALRSRRSIFAVLWKYGAIIAERIWKR